MSGRDVKALTSLSKSMFMFLQFPHLSHAEQGEKGFSVCKAKNKRTVVTCI